MKNKENCKTGETCRKVQALGQRDFFNAPRSLQGKERFHRLHSNAVVVLFILSAFSLCACGGEEKNSGYSGANVSSIYTENSGMSSEDGDDEEYVEEYEEEIVDAEEYTEDEDCDEDFEEKTVQKKAPASNSVKKNVSRKKDANYNAGMEAYHAGKGLEAVRLFKASGSAQATYMLGVIYETGCGNVGSNPMMAKKFYKKAATMGSEEAQGKL